MLDDTDRRILRHFQAAPELVSSDLADRAGVTPSTLARRLDRMRTRGVLRGARTLDKTQARAFDDFIEAARDVPEVIEIQTFLGQVDVRLSIIARDMAHYQQVYRSRILTLPHISDLDALMHVARLKTDETLPL